MEIRAAVFHRVHEPVPIEAIEVDKPSGREVLTYASGDGGGWLGNVNRWRQQLGLSELPETELKTATTPLETPAGNANVVQLSGTDARTGKKAGLVGAMVPKGSQTWFYKLMGDEAVVAREKEAFTRFIKSAKYPNAS